MPPCGSQWRLASARAQPQPLGLREHDIGHGAIDHRIWGSPTSIAHMHHGSAGVAIIDEHGLLAMLVLEVAEVLARAVVIDARWCATVGRVVVVY